MRKIWREPGEAGKASDHDAGVTHSKDTTGRVGPLALQTKGVLTKNAPAKAGRQRSPEPPRNGLPQHITGEEQLVGSEASVQIWGWISEHSWGPGSVTLPVVGGLQGTQSWPPNEPLCSSICVCNYGPVL